MAELFKSGHTGDMISMVNKQPKWNDSVRGQVLQTSGVMAGPALVLSPTVQNQALHLLPLPGLLSLSTVAFGDHSSLCRWARMSSTSTGASRWPP